MNLPELTPVNVFAVRQAIWKCTKPTEMMEAALLEEVYTVVSAISEGQVKVVVV